MSTLGIFILGLFITGLTISATVMVGIQEAADESLTQVEDLTELEKKITGRVSETD